MEEVEKWVKKAEKDLERAELLFSHKDFEGCAFYSHQAAEKALKALYILKFKRLWKIHDLKELASTIGAPSSIIKLGDALNLITSILDTPSKSLTRRGWLKRR